MFAGYLNYLIAAVIVFSSPPALGFDFNQKSPVKAEVFLDHSEVKPGGGFLLGVKFTIEPGWHIYWKDPGDAGLPTRIMLEEPGTGRFVLGKLLWPEKEIFLQPGGIKGYGYEDSVMIMAKVTADKSLKAGNSYTLKIRAKWLACGRICVPGEKLLSTEVKISNKTGSADSALFNEWLKRVEF